MASELEDPDDDELRKTVRISMPRGRADEAPTLARSPSATPRARSSRPLARDNGPSLALATGQSAGQANAYYAPSKPHAVAPSRKVSDDPGTPAVIVQEEPEERTLPDASALGSRPHDTNPSGPPSDSFATTVPLGSPVLGGSGRPPGPLAGRPTTPFDRTNILPRSQSARSLHKTTVILKPGRRRGQDTLLALIGLAILAIACLIAAVAWKRPDWLGLGKAPGDAPSSTVQVQGADLASPPATQGRSSPRR